MVKILNPFIQHQMATVIKSISVSLEFNKLAEDNKISFSEAARIGMSLMLAERGIKEYDNNFNLIRRMNFFRQQAEEALQKVADLQNKYETKSSIEIKDNA
jgi:hypothetical protein